MCERPKTRLAVLYDEMAEAAKCAGVQPTEADVAAWVGDNVTYRPDTEFFIVLGVACALADALARDEGYRGQSHRILVMMRGGGAVGPVRNPRPRLQTV